MPPLFHFKQFSIDDSQCAMKVGMDAVFLGAWTNIKNAERILEIGTGSGLIALMLAQKSNALVDAIEIDKQAFEQAKINIANSFWKERINVIHSSIQDYCKSNKTKYDLIVTNPPYFINSYKAPLKKRRIARHNDLLSHEDIINSSLNLLANYGRLNLIISFNEGMIFKTKSETSKLYCNMITYIKPNANKSPNRLMMEFSNNNKTLIENELIIEKAKRHDYTDAYKELTRDFYLSF